MDKILWSRRPFAHLFDSCPASLVRSGQGGQAKCTGRVINSSQRMVLVHLNLTKVGTLQNKSILGSIILNLRTAGKFVTSHF